MHDLTKRLEEALIDTAKKRIRCPVCDSKGTDIFKHADDVCWCNNCAHEGPKKDFLQTVGMPLHAALLKCIEAMAWQIKTFSVKAEGMGEVAVIEKGEDALAELREALEGGK